VVASGAAGAYPTNDVLLFRPDRSKVEPRFVTVALNLPRARDTLSAGSQGAALSRLSIGTLGSLKISVPPLETQRKIAALADCMEAERRLLERLRELHRQLNQQILQRLLGNAHDEGGNPRRGSHQADGPEGPSVSPHLEVRNT
jgi:type I restriction enzyme S subunit